jgi:cation:H+ antiporter
LFVAAAVRMAGFLRMPRVVIGSTIVSLATTMPEMVVSVIAGARGNSGLAVGNAIGSCVCNIGLILGVTAFLKRVDIHPRTLRTALLTMAGLGVALFVMTLDLALARWQGGVLLVAGAAYFAYDLIDAARKRGPQLVSEAKAIEQAATRSWAWFQTRAGTVAQFTLAAGLVVFSSRLVVDGAVNLAAALGIPPLVIGLTVVAVGTSLPELITALGSARRQVSDLSVGNIIGANIANLSIVIGVAATLTPVTMTRLTQLFDFPAMLAMIGLLVWALMTQHRLTRREGIILITSYVAYIAAVVILAVLGYRN